MFLIDWFLTIFAKCLTVDVASVVWDLFLLDGELVLYCTAIAIFRIVEEPFLHPDGRKGPRAVQPDLESCCRVLNEDGDIIIQIIIHVVSYYIYVCYVTLRTLQQNGRGVAGSSD